MRPQFELSDFLKFRDDREAAMRFLVGFGALAPSRHNTQPWKFRIRENAIEVWGEEKRALPVFDPTRREFYISIGCAIENVLIACEYYNLPVHLTYFPEPVEPLYVARMTIDRLVVTNPILSPDHLATHIQARHNNRSNFDDALAVPDVFIEEATRMTSSAEVELRFVTAPEKRSALAAAAAQAAEDAFNDREFTTELSHWISGIPEYNVGVPEFFAPLALRLFNLAKMQRKIVDEMLTHTPAFGIFSTPQDSPPNWVRAGKHLEHLWLMADHAGLKLGVLPAGIEIGEHYRALQDILGTTNRPQIFFRIGYSDKVPPPSPRMKVKDLIFN